MTTLKRNVVQLQHLVSPTGSKPSTAQQVAMPPPALPPAWPVLAPQKAGGEAQVSWDACIAAQALHVAHWVVFKMLAWLACPLS